MASSILDSLRPRRSALPRLLAFWSMLVTKVELNMRNVCKYTSRTRESTDHRYLQNAAMFNAVLKHCCEKAFIQQKLCEKISWTICFSFFAVTLGHQRNPFVIAVNQSRPQLQASAKEASYKLFRDTFQA